MSGCYFRPQPPASGEAIYCELPPDTSGQEQRVQLLPMERPKRRAAACFLVPTQPTEESRGFRLYRDRHGWVLCNDERVWRELPPPTLRSLAGLRAVRLGALVLGIGLVISLMGLWLSHPAEVSTLYAYPDGPDSLRLTAEQGYSPPAAVWLQHRRQWHLYLPNQLPGGTP